MASNDTLFTVSEREVFAALSIPIPPHPETTFHEAELRCLIACAFSITMVEKVEILTSLGRYSQAQIDSLIAILKHERREFARLNIKHRRRMEEIEARALPVN